MKHLSHKGFSTLELLIAFAVMTLSMTAVIMVAFGNQSTAIDTELAQRGLYVAAERLEEAGAAMKANFDAIASEFAATAYSATYDTQLTVFDISECAKRVESEAFWDRDLRDLSSSLSMVFTSPEASAAIGGDCSTEETTGWEAPQFYENPDPIHAGSQAYAVDVLKNDKGTFAFLASSKTGNQPSFWVIDVTDPDNPETIGEFESGSDIYAIDAFAQGDTVYAFIASASTTAQLQVIATDLTSYPGSNPVPARIAQAALPGVSGAQAAGRAVAYYDEKVYIGTRRTAGNEFHVFDASSPSMLSHLGSLELNHSVSEIALRGNDAYIAATAQTAAGCELIVLDVSDPASITNPCTPTSVSGVRNFRAPGNFGGTSVEAFGDKVFLGRQRSGVSHDFYVLKNTNVDAITQLGSEDLNINSNTEVTGLKVSGSLAFIATSDTTPNNGGGPFLVYNIEDPSNMTLMSLCATNYSEGSTDLDLFENAVYISNESNKALRIFYPSLTCS